MDEEMESLKLLILQLHACLLISKISIIPMYTKNKHDAMVNAEK